MKLDFAQIELRQLITHLVGNKLRNEKYSLSNDVSILASDTKELLLKYFLLPIKSIELYSFSHPIDISLNEIYVITQEIFSKPKSFINSSKNIAKLLYEQSMHPKIQAGELNLAFFSNVILDDEVVDAIGIFKSEEQTPFIRMKSHDSFFKINHDFGFDVGSMKKGCIVFNTNREKGFKVLVADNSNKSEEAQYWKDNFLKISAIKDGFHKTLDLLSITKDFVTNHAVEQFDVSRTAQIDLLNKSVDYFKEHKNFNRKEFENEVFQEPAMIKSFRKFDSNFREANDIDGIEDFEISTQAVKRQIKVFKSILRLDKNFDIHIHGDPKLIQKGVEKDGRKYYKIYYKEES